jgi:hypothetical protein
MGNVQNCDSYGNIPSWQAYRSRIHLVLKHVLRHCKCPQILKRSHKTELLNADGIEPGFIAAVLRNLNLLWIVGFSNNEAGSDELVMCVLWDYYLNDEGQESTAVPTFCKPLFLCFLHCLISVTQ